MSFDSDFYTKKAMDEGKRARSYYKLEEIDQKFKIFPTAKTNKVITVLDLGCAPGSWSQYVMEKMGKGSTLIGIDLKVMKPFKPIFYHEKFKLEFIEGDIRKLDEILSKKGFQTPFFDLIISDMAPNTTGDRSADAYNSYELVLEMAEINAKWLKKGGFWVAKYFQGEEFTELRIKLKAENESIKILKPKATKKNSVETFIIGKK